MTENVRSKGQGKKWVPRQEASHSPHSAKLVSVEVVTKSVLESETEPTKGSRAPLKEKTGREKEVKKVVKEKPTKKRGEVVQDGPEKKREHKKKDQKVERKPSKSEKVEKETREKNSAVMYNMWASEQRPTTKPSEKPRSSHTILSSEPTLRDMQSVVFSASNDFVIDEIVLAPRTRGGFSYAKITKQLLRTQCFFDLAVQHELYTWRVVYFSNKKSLYKDLPSAYIGKLPEGPHVGHRYTEETEEAAADEDETLKVIGEKPDIKDLQSVVFSPQCTFKQDELVLVPRSNGGFTYGKIYKESKQNCKLSIKDTHPLNAWKVIVSTEHANKELCTACIGKIQLWDSTNVHVPKKSRHAIFTECEYPNPELATKKESEILEEAERLASLEDKSPNYDESYLDEVVTLTEGMGELPELKLVNMQPTTPQITIPVPEAQPNKPSTSPPQQAPLQVGGIIAIDKQDLFRKLMTPKQTRLEHTEEKHLIVLDGANVAKKHGKDTEFSTEGLNIAIKYWTDKGHDALAFLPEHYVKRKPGQGPVTLNEYLPKAKNLPLIMGLIDKGQVILTPPQDYDDTYVIEYAMKHNACIVTNDRYWDHIEKQGEKGQKAKRETLKWIRDHTISFTFVRDEFMPNPNFKFPPLKKEKE